MTWVTFIVCAVGVWAMLSLIGGYRARRLGEIQARLRAEAEAAEESKQKHDEIVSVG